MKLRELLKKISKTKEIRLEYGIFETTSVLYADTDEINEHIANLEVVDIDTCGDTITIKLEDN